jgi:DNA-directed RNA polymerase subunit F
MNISKKIIEELQQVTGLTEKKLAILADLNPATVRSVRYRGTELSVDRALKLIALLKKLNSQKAAELCRELLQLGSQDND